MESWIIKNLPDFYLPVLVNENKLNKSLGFGILDTKNNTLYHYGSEEVFRYTENEIRECFILLNPEDGFRYDLEKVLNKK